MPPLTVAASSPGGSVRGERANLKGSFSAVSKPNFATKYALESSRRDLHNALLCTVWNPKWKNPGKTTNKFL